MKKLLFPMLLVAAWSLSSRHAAAQTTIGANQAPDSSAILDLRSPNKGLLLPQVSLSNTGSWSLAGATPKGGMVVYNTNAAITGSNAQGIGIYVWSGSSWNKAISNADVTGDNLGNHRATTTLHMANNTIDSISTSNVYYQESIHDRTAGNTNSVNLYKSNGTFGISTTTNGDAINITESNNNVGIGTNSPSNRLTVNAPANPLKLTGLTASSNATDNTLLVDSSGVVRKGAPVPHLGLSDVGTVIAVNGQMIVAQEITVSMTADFDVANGTAAAIGNLNNVVLDNQNRFTATSGANSFTVGASGTYQVIMNVLLSVPSCANSFPAVGIWSDTDNGWVAKAAEQYYANALTSPGSRYEQIYTLITAVTMTQGKTYSFRAGVPASCATGSVLATSPGATGAGPATYCSIRRLK